MSKNKKTKICDPALCDHCVYIGEGDFMDKFGKQGASGDLN